MRGWGYSPSVEGKNSGNDVKRKEIEGISR
jgi:hypothetical protein